MNLTELMEQFRAIPGARVGTPTPSHVALPGVSAQEEIATFLATYLLLSRDTEYTHFLRTYGGASIFQSPTFVDIWGFAEDEASTSMYEVEDPVVDEAGILMFALVVREDLPEPSQQISFGFPVTDAHAQGVYYGSSRTNFVWKWYGPTFLAWLHDVVVHQGRLEEPGKIRR